MRRLLLPTCLFITAWAQPTDSLIKLNSNDSNVVPPSIRLRGTTAAATSEEPADVTPQAPVEITAELAPVTTEAPVEEAAVPTPAVPLPPRRAIPHNLVCQELALAAIDNDLPAPFLIKLINQESGFNQHIVSKAGAQGVAQFMPETAREMKLDDPFNPLKAVRASAQLLRNLFEQFGRKLGLAAAAYNAGPRRVQDWLDKKGSLPQETRDYVERITGRKADEWKAGSVAPTLRVPSSAPCQREAGLFASNGPESIPLPPSHRGGELTVARAAKEGGAKIIKIAGGPAPKPAAAKDTKPAKLDAKSKTVTITVAAKRAAKRTNKSASAKKVRVAEARPHK